MRILGHDVRNVDEAGRPTLAEQTWKQSVQRFMRNAVDFITTGKIVIGEPSGGDKGDGALNAEELYEDGRRVFTQGGEASGGVDHNVHDLGTVTGGTLTLDPLNGFVQKVVNNGAFTLSPASSRGGSCVLHITNGASAGVVTFTGFTKKYPSGSLTTTSADKFTITVYFLDGDGTDYVIQPRQ